jgi:hypothetical protein
MRNGMCSVVNDDTNHEYCVLKQGDFFGATALNVTETVCSKKMEKKLIKTMIPVLFY